MLSIGTMKVQHTVAAIANREGQDSQPFLTAAVADWRAAGARVVGVLAEQNDVEGMCSAGFLRDIATGSRYSIHLDTPPVGNTCHLDAAGMNGACAGLLGQIGSADVVVISKFGKLEAMRQGLWTAFDACVRAEKPLLTTVSYKHVGAWTQFAPEAAWLDAHAPSIERWWRTTLAQAH